MQEADGTIHVVHDFQRKGGDDGTGAKTVVYHRISEADIKAGRIVTPDSVLGKIANQATHRTLSPEEYDRLKATAAESEEAPEPPAARANP